MEEDEEIGNSIEEDEEEEEIREFYRRLGVEEKGIDAFFLEIVRTDDTRKVGNLSYEELGLPQLPIRTLFELARDCEKIPSMSSFEKDFKENAEMILATSLSKEGFLIKARITQKKEILGRERKRTKKGLFVKKEETEES